MAIDPVTVLATETPASRHYQAGIGDEGLLARLQPMLDALPPGDAGERQLAALDHFHVRGPAASAELAELAEVRAGERVLDAGSGLGGPSRFLARIHGCSVLGVDLTPEFVSLATHLAERAGLSDRVRYQVGDIAKLPLADGAVDLVWTEHVLMNLADRDAAYREFHRVLRADGRVAFYEPVAVSSATPHYPVPWAGSAADSYLLTEEETVAALERSGFRLLEWRDASPAAMAAFAQAQTPAPGVGLAMVMGPRFPEMAANFARNIGEARIKLAMGVAVRAG